MRAGKGAHVGGVAAWTRGDPPGRLQLAGNSGVTQQRSGPNRIVAGFAARPAPWRELLICTAPGAPPGARPITALTAEAAAGGTLRVSCALAWPVASSRAPATSAHATWRGLAPIASAAAGAGDEVASTGGCGPLEREAIRTRACKERSACTRSLRGVLMGCSSLPRTHQGRCDRGKVRRCAATRARGGAWQHVRRGRRQCAVLLRAPRPRSRRQSNSAELRAAGRAHAVTVGHSPSRQSLAPPVEDNPSRLK